MSRKKTRIAKRLGATALAVATLASGLSFGAASASASAPAEVSPRLNAVAGATFKLVHKHNPSLGVWEWGVMNADGKRVVYKTEAEALKNAPSWTVYKWDGQNKLTVNLASDLSRCLTVTGVDTSHGSAVTHGAGCNVTPNQSTTWRIEQGNLRFAQFSTPGFLTGEPANGHPSTAGRFDVANRNVRFDTLPSDPTKPNPPAANGGVLAQAGPAATLDRSKATEVRVGTKATAKYTSAKYTVTIKAPAGTSFASGQTSVIGAWSKPGGNFSRVDALNLYDVTVNGQTMTGTFDSSKSTSFGQDKDYELAWYPKLSVTDGASTGMHNLAFTVSGNTSIGATNVSANTQVTIPQVTNGGVVAQAGPAATLDRSKATEVRVGTKATAKYTSANQTVTVVAPAGTTFAPNQTTVAGAWSSNGTSYAKDDTLTLTDVTVSGNKMTGKFDSSRSANFTQQKDYQLAWYPKLTVSDGASAGNLSVAFTVTGTTNLGNTNVNAATQVTVPGESVPAPGARVVFDQDVSKQAKITGTAEAGATVEVRDADNALVGSPEVVNGQFSLSFPAPGAGVHEYTVTQTVGGSTSAATRVSADFGAGVEITRPSGSVAPGMVEVTGTTQAGAKVTVEAGGKKANATVTGTTWTASIEVAPADAPVTITATQQSKGALTTTDTTTVTTDGAQQLRPVAISGPGTYENGVNVKVTGKASPYAQVKVFHQFSGAPIKTVNADVNGDWSFWRGFGPNVSYTLTATQLLTDGQTSTSAAFTLNPEGFNDQADVEITGPVNGRFDPARGNIVSGTAASNATVTIKSQWDTLTTVKADAQGKWSFNRGFGNVVYILTAEQTRTDNATSTSKPFVMAPIASQSNPVAITGPLDGHNVSSTLVTGVAAPGAEVTISAKWPTSTQVIKTVEADENGEWSFHRGFADITYTLTAKQDRIDGTSSVSPEFVSNPKK